MMSLNPAKGNMYSWVYTTNPIHGKCPHACSYCYVPATRAKKLYQGEPHLVDSFFEKGLGKFKTIFVGSCFDLFAKELNASWIETILVYCRSYPTNTYLFQSKNTYHMWKYQMFFPPKAIIGTTAETNRSTQNISKAPDPIERLSWLSEFADSKTMISLEPLMNFDLSIFLSMIKNAKPSFVSVGADSKRHHLSEPPAGKIKELITELKKFTEVKIKLNLERLTI